MSTLVSSPRPPLPQLFTNIETLITGKYEEAGLLIFRNGLLQTPGADYTRVGGTVEFVDPPISTELLKARVFAIGKQLGGDSPRRYVSPWALSIRGALDGVATRYQVVFGPTILGTLDSVNKTFTWGVTLQRSQIWRNGVYQTLSEDIAVGPTSMVFLHFAPDPGDIIVMLGY